MKLDEAIEHAKEVAENWKSQLVNCVSEEGRNKCLECANDHEQLAAWLEELSEHCSDEFAELVRKVLAEHWSSEPYKSNIKGGTA